ncbi:MAG: response regulator [Euryarchaeota archaeon]|nr:response regulator [Euryarchaeota archaeon]
MGEGLKMLVVDDNQDITKLIKIYFTKRGYEVLIANKGEEAFKLMEQNPDIDVILLDVMLPDFSGIEILEQIRGIMKNAVIIMVTGVNDLETVVNAMKLGADDYVVKPFRLGEMEQKIENLMFKKTIVNGEEHLTAEDALNILNETKSQGVNLVFSFDDIEEFNQFIEMVKGMEDVSIEDMQIGEKYEVRLKAS